MLPINLSSHWSLCVVVNAHYLHNYFTGSMKKELDEEVPFMMLLDLLGMHDSNAISTNIWKWLVYEWSTKSGNVDANNAFQLSMVTPKGIFQSATVIPFIYFVYFISQCMYI
jgi:hypothetical protein